MPGVKSPPFMVIFMVPLLFMGIVFLRAPFISNTSRLELCVFGGTKHFTTVVWLKGFGLFWYSIACAPLSALVFGMAAFFCCVAPILLFNVRCVVPLQQQAARACFKLSTVLDNSCTAF